MKDELRFRQVHLDFHTSPDIEGIAAEFDPDEFASTLEKARVDSVTCFARCHHGMIYYDSKLNPERVHPGLVRRDLLAEQIEACHRRDIRVPIYTTVQWDEYTANEHRDWLMIDEDGREFGTRPLEAGFYRNLDVLHPGYRAFLKAHVKEILETLPVDGFFLDIVQPQHSLARHWLRAMDEAGYDLEDDLDRRRFGVKVIDEWKLEMTGFIRRLNRDCTIFYNAGHVGPRHRATLEAYTHYEIESLPSGGWGYLNFPLVARYARGLGYDCLGMTGKFHTSWGDFHSFKNEAALGFECFHALALGARCSVGDQLHPTGRIDPHTYDLIGGVYGEVEKKEPWCSGAEAVTEIGVLTPEEFALRRRAAGAEAERDQPAVAGALRMLQELRLQFDVIDAGRDFSKYRLVVMPDAIPADGELAQKLEGHLASGGSVLASFRSGLAPEGDPPAGGGRFATDALGVALKGEAPPSPDFIVPEGAIGKGLRSTGHVMYLRGMEVEPVDGAEVLARVEVPYFNRTWRHFCSHAHTPSSGEACYPGIVRKGNAVYFAHPVFTQYDANAPRWCKRLVSNAVDLLLGRRLVEADAPSTLLAALNHQAAKRRYVLHLLHYVPERRGRAFDVIEDVIPLYDVKVSVAVDGNAAGRVSAVALVPEGKALEFVERDGRAEFTVPAVEGHRMVEIAFG